MRIIITGSSSSIGTHLAKKLIHQGHEIICFNGTRDKNWRLGEPIPKVKEVDALIHLAHDRCNSIEMNVDAAKIICKSFTGLKIFLSSMSAHSESKSKYGKSKYLQECIFLNNNGRVVRAGIVYGKDIEGIYSSIASLVRKFKYLPLPYYGLPNLFMTHIDDLTDELIDTIQTTPSGPIFAANPLQLSLHRVFRIISLLEHSNSKLVLLPRQPFEFIFIMISKLLPKIHFVDSILSISKSISPSEISYLEKPKRKFRSIV